MRIRLWMLALLSIVPVMVFGGSPAGFDNYFIDRTLRIDVYHMGDAKEEFISLDRVYLEGIWAGSRTYLQDDYGVGRYLAQVRDPASGQLLYSYGYDTYFGEYRTTPSAQGGVKRTFQESVLIPCPKQKVRLDISVHEKGNALRSIFSQEIDPADMMVVRESPLNGVKVYKLVTSGDPHVKVDLAILAEGYTAAEEPKVKKDLARVVQVFFSHEPYKTYRDRFNVYGVFLPSAESGCDEPGHGAFKNTVLGTTFDSLGSERYLLTEENRRMRDLTAHVPCDKVMIMVNHKRYGGGGIYNLYCTFTTDNQWFPYLMLHEFGHHFACLADEYYTSSTAYNEFYPPGVEPVEPNITALLDPANLKWKDLDTPGIAIPTPWEKEGFDKMDLAYQKVRQELNEQIAKMKRAHAPAAEVAAVEEKAERLSLESARQVDEYLKKSKYWGQVGAFKGAGYASEGLYRPMLDCLMFSKGDKPFCKVCEAAVIRMIRRLSE